MPSVADLPWLPRPPSDFTARCAALSSGARSPGLGETVQHLASHGLDARQARRLARTIDRLIEAGDDVAPLSRLRLVVLSNATFDFIADHMPAAAARHGVALDLILPPFDQAMQEALDPNSRTARSGADAILLAFDHNWYGLGGGALGDPAGALDRALDRLEALASALAASTRASLIFSTVPPPPGALFGSFDARVAGSPRALIDALNEGIVRLATERTALLLDTDALAASLGTDNWFDPVQYFAYNLPFASRFDAVYADWVGRLLGAARGKARKCLVLDLDNTLWGGVVGDDGVEGLALGPGGARGESFLAIQKMARRLKERGVILAVSSKNDDAVARAAFQSHPEMVLRLEDIAVFQANWLDKATNLEAIARTLNIGLDALVLLDDNPAERAQARAALPMVAVPELADDPAWFPWTLMQAGYFEAVGYSEEDRIRASAYASDARRAEVQATTRDLGDYLSSLEMRLTVAPFDATGRTRIAQLINKTNQFNLTTKRYSESQVAAMEGDPTVITLQVRLSDRFGDLGMIGIVIAHLLDGADGVREADVDSWLMSCRVLGRKVEEAMLALVLERAAAAGVGLIRARYRPTAKNGMVRDLFDRLGLSLIEADAEGVRHYQLSLSEAETRDLPMVIVRPAAWGEAGSPTDLAAPR